MKILRNCFLFSLLALVAGLPAFGEKCPELKLIATGPIKLLIIKTNDQPSHIFRNLKKGAVKVIPLPNNPSFTGGVSDIENLTFEINGQQFEFEGTGPRTISWPPKPPTP